MISGDGLLCNERSATSNEKAPPPPTPRSSYTFPSDLWLKSPGLPVRPHPGNSLMKKGGGETWAEPSGQWPRWTGWFSLPLLPRFRAEQGHMSGGLALSLSPRTHQASQGPCHMRTQGRLAPTLGEASALCWPLAASASGPGVTLLGGLAWPDRGSGNIRGPA